MSLERGNAPGDPSAGDSRAAPPASPDRAATGTARAAGAPLAIRSVEPIALEIPLGRTVANPILAFSSHVALLVRVLDADGVEGWGEVWCNFPRFGLAHRARIVAEVLAPLVTGRTYATPEDAYAAMTAATRLLRVQSGEPGPVSSAIAGIDIALHDIAGKRAGLPLWRMLGGASGAVAVYASIGRADDARTAVERGLERGLRAFKLRSAGTIDAHLAAVRPIRAITGDDVELMLDVNGSWPEDEALAHLARLDALGLAWLEEPVPADTPAGTWSRLAAATVTPLAGGENLVGPAAFDEALALGALAVLQPDLTKWGGLSAGLPLARRIVASGRRYCPHAFSGAIGLVASAHLLAASGSADGMVELGVGSHPARDAVLDGNWQRPRIELGVAPGLGIEVDQRRLDTFRRAV